MLRVNYTHGPACVCKWLQLFAVRCELHVMEISALIGDVLVGQRADVRGVGGCLMDRAGGQALFHSRLWYELLVPSCSNSICCPGGFRTVFSADMSTKTTPCFKRCSEMNVEKNTVVWELTLCSLV
jgi:hypothetical protein